MIFLNIGSLLLNAVPAATRPASAVDADFPGESAAEPTVPHRHAFTETLLSAATCAAPGEKLLVCGNCGAVIRRQIPATGEHQFRLVDTANENGRSEPHRICERCGLDCDAAPARFEGETLQRLNDIFRKYGAVSMQVALVKSGRVAASQAFGTADRRTGRTADTDTKYRTASISKLVTFLVFMALQDRGLTDVNEDISVYFGYPCRNPLYPDDVITPEMLMSHTAGFVTHGITRLYDGALNKSGQYYRSRPGAEYSYSNLGAALVSPICENASGRYLDDLAGEYLFDPLGIDAAFQASGLKDSDNIGALYGENGGLSVATQLGLREAPLGTDLNLPLGNLMISAKDYAKILAMLINGGKNNAGETVLSENAVLDVLLPHFSTPDFDVGFGVQIHQNVIGDKLVYVHTGSAWGMYSAFVFSIEERCGAVVLATGCPRNEDPDNEIYRICLDAIRTVWPAAQPEATAPAQADGTAQGE